MDAGSGLATVPGPRLTSPGASLDGNRRADRLLGRRGSGEWVPRTDSRRLREWHAFDPASAAPATGRTMVGVLRLADGLVLGTGAPRAGPGGGFFTFGRCDENENESEADPDADAGGRRRRSLLTTTQLAASLASVSRGEFLVSVLREPAHSAPAYYSKPAQSRPPPSQPSSHRGSTASSSSLTRGASDAGSRHTASFSTSSELEGGSLSSVSFDHLEIPPRPHGNHGLGNHGLESVSLRLLTLAGARDVLVCPPEVPPLHDPPPAGAGEGLGGWRRRRRSEADAGRCVFDGPEPVTRVHDTGTRVHDTGTRVHDTGTRVPEAPAAAEAAASRLLSLWRAEAACHGLESGNRGLESLNHGLESLPRTTVEVIGYVALRLRRATDSRGHGLSPRVNHGLSHGLGLGLGGSPVTPRSPLSMTPPPGGWHPTVAENPTDAGHPTVAGQPAVAGAAGRAAWLARVTSLLPAARRGSTGSLDDRTSFGLQLEVLRLLARLWP